MYRIYQPVRHTEIQDSPLLLEMSFGEKVPKSLETFILPCIYCRSFNVVFTGNRAKYFFSNLLWLESIHFTLFFSFILQYTIYQYLTLVVLARNMEGT